MLNDKYYFPLIHFPYYTLIVIKLQSINLLFSIKEVPLVRSRKEHNLKIYYLSMILNDKYYYINNIIDTPLL